jgi:hypothetical protein
MCALLSGVWACTDGITRVEQLAEPLQGGVCCGYEIIIGSQIKQGLNGGTDGVKLGVEIAGGADGDHDVSPMREETEGAFETEVALLQIIRIQ